MRQTFKIPDGQTIGRQTTASDVQGWDSLSHSILLMKIETEFGIDLPIDKIYDLEDVGALVDLVSSVHEGH